MKIVVIGHGIGAALQPIVLDRAFFALPEFGKGDGRTINVVSVGSLLLAVGLHPRNWISLLVIFIPPTAALLYRIHVEEIALREHFGQEYIDYSRQTSRLIPGIY